MSSIHQKLSALRSGSDSVAETLPGRSAIGRDRLARLLPVGLLLGFVALIGLVLGDRLLPAREVVVSTVVTLQASDEVSGERTEAETIEEAPMWFQASGWVEPDPLPIKVPALVDGVVRQVHVLEGETVKKGQVLATLIDDDAKLNLRTAESQLASLEAMAEAQLGEIAVIEAEKATLAMRVVAARAKRAEREDEVRRYDQLAADGSRSVAEREMALARLRLATQQAEIDALQWSEEELAAKLLREAARGRDFAARIEEARTEVERRQLALSRTRIASPLDGLVLRLAVVPGQKRMMAMDQEDSSTIAILYQPGHLQARIDVPLAEASRLSLGQPVRLRSSLLADHIFHGEVVRIVGEADLQRNTIQAKVRIHDPDPRLRPEMLCRAEFLAPTAPSPERESAGKGTGKESETISRGSGAVVRVFAPEAALIDATTDAAKVWRIDDSGERVELREIALGGERRGAHRLVLAGLRPGDRVVLDPPSDLEVGERVRQES